MRILCAVTIVLILSFTAALHADPPVTQPSPAGLSPKQTLLYWQDHVSSMTVDELLQCCAYYGDRQTAMAKAMAGEVFAISKLQKAVDDKWGKDSETVVLHACQSDTRQDDEQANEQIDGDHAVITFRAGAVQPFQMVRVDGVWKMDIATYMGDGVAVVPNFSPEPTVPIHQFTKILNTATAAVADGKYSDADTLAKDIESKLAGLQPAQ